MIDVSEPIIRDSDFILYHGDARIMLEELPSASVHMCVTSPPYYALRDYDEDGQIGLESTPEQYVDRLVSVFGEVKRVLRNDGTLWLNLGDTYIDKELLGVPWMVANALRQDGWKLRSEIIWWKPDAMPESISDRPGRDHEHVFMFSKQDRYFYDIDAERVPHKIDGRKKTTVKQGANSVQHRDGERWPNGGRNMRTVWEITTENFPGAHFAVFPRELARRCISLATSAKGVCGVCGAQWTRVVEASGESVQQRQSRQPERWVNGKGIAPRSDGGNVQQGVRLKKEDATRETVGWMPSCQCEYWRLAKHGAGFVPVELAKPVVLDPFMGSGTTALVARAHARACVGIELSEKSCGIIRDRTQQLSLLG